MSKMLWELKAPLVVARAKEDMGLNNIFKYLRYYFMYLARYTWKIKGVDYTNRIENLLFWRGKVAFYKDPVFGIVICEVDAEKKDPNGNITSCSLSAEGGWKIKSAEVGKDCVIIYADDTHFAPVLYIWSIANEIITREDIIDQQDNMLRKPILVTGEGAELDNAMAKIGNVLSGVEWFNLKPSKDKGGNILSNQPLEVLNLQVGNAYKGKELWESRGKWEELLMDYMGYRTVNNEKKERMIQVEVEQSSSICDTFYNSATKSREDGKKQVMSVLGEDIEFIKNIKEEEVEDNDSENEMGKTDNEPKE